MRFDRLWWLGFVFAMLWLAGLVQSFQIQVIEKDHYREGAKKRALKQIDLYAEKGKIMDRHGYVLADNIRDESNKFLDYSRIFLHGETAAQLIGKVGYNGKGAMGLEYLFDDKLRGSAGYSLNVKTAKNETVYGMEKAYEEAIPGKDMVLTIDKDMQKIVEKALKDGVEKFRATSASAIIVDPFSGEILAMGSYPTFDPNQKQTGSFSRAFRNDLVSLSFEPGSTFKVITAAAALEEKVINPEQKISGEKGRWVLPNGEVIRDTRDHGSMDMTEAMTYSSNIVYAKIADLIGAEKFYRFVRDFGFGSKTSDNFLGEETGYLKEPHIWSGRTLKTMGFGHELTVTPIQMVMAFSAIANGGKLMQPMIIKEWRDKSGAVIESNKALEVRRVISEQSAAKIRDMLHQVVEHGTAQSVLSSKIANVDFGGKTGTAEKYDPKLKRYDRNSQIASFIGFSPARDVRYVCLVLLDDPQTVTVGGLTAGPIFKNIMESIYFHPKLSPTPYNLVQIEENQACDLNYVGKTVEKAKAMAEKNNCFISIKGNGSIVVSQKKDFVKEASYELDTKDRSYLEMPNLKGLTLKDALELMSLVRAKVEFTGKGYVKEQSPAPMTKISKDQVCKLILKDEV